MLTAKTKTGKKLCLGYPYKKETLITLRNKEEFFCPLCGERVFLKLGEQKIYHFAHQKGGNCREEYENETEYHMVGKLQLFRWLRSQRIPAELEYYDQMIGQRPDILFYYQDRKYAMEYQCSSISEQIFRARNDNYLRHGYIPIWIIGGNHFKKNFNHSASLTSFDYFFLHKAKNGQFFIPSFSPEKSIFQLIYSIFPYSVKNALIQKLTKPIKSVTLPFLLEPLIETQLNPNDWRLEIENYKLRWPQYPSDQQRSFLNELYLHKLNLFLFPPEIGVPLSNGFLIRTPPFVWQAYYYFDILQDLLPGDLVKMKEITNCLENRMNAGKIMTRSTPQIEKANPQSAFIDYTRFLVKQGIFEQKSNELFQLQKCLQIPQTNREKENMMSRFYQKKL